MKVFNIVVLFCLTFFNVGLHAEVLNDAVLRSAVVVGDVDLPNKLVSGNTYSIDWMVQAYVPVKSRIQFKFSDRTKIEVEGRLLRQETGDFSISGRSSKKYFFRGSVSIPSDKNGDATIGFHNAQKDGNSPFWMYGLFPTGVIERPYGTSGKLFYVSIEGANKPDANVALLLHGMNSGPETWNTFTQAQFNGSNRCPIIYDGTIQGTDRETNYKSKVMCYRIKFGSHDQRSSGGRNGLENIRAFAPSSGDFSTFDQLGAEINDAVRAIINKHSNNSVKIMLVAHSRGGLAARAFMQTPSNSVEKNTVVGIATTGTPHLGSPLGRVYTYLENNCYKNGIQRDGCAADFQVVDLLRGARSCFGKRSNSLDLRRPTIGDLSDNSLAISAITRNTSNLPTGKYGYLEYRGKKLGALTDDPVEYTVFNEPGTDLCDQVSNDATKAALGTGSTGDASHTGDGIVPGNNQRFPRNVVTQAYSVSSGITYHIQEPEKQAHINTLLTALVPNWKWK